MEQLEALFARAKQHRVPMAAICKRADVDPTTPSRWKRGKNGATLDRLTRLADALDGIIAEGSSPVPQAAEAA